MESQQNTGRNASGDQSGTVVCAQCGAPMPREMRFCRNCGNRLGEGPAEYTETVLLPNSRHTGARAGDRFAPGFTSPMMYPTTGKVSRGRRRRLGGMTWVFIALAIFFVGGGALSVLKKARTNIPTIIRANLERSYFGANEFVNTEGGVTFADVEPPDSPADKAGLVGGDIITSFDGHAAQDEDEMMDLLRQTPPGKTVEVTYIRDGEVRTAQLTTISQRQFRELETAFRNRTVGQGQLGFDDDEARVVPINGTKIKGVQLNDLSLSGPAALAGLERGDIITEFDGIPIRTVGELVARVRRAIPYSTVKVVVMRGTERIEIPVKIGKLR